MAEKRRLVVVGDDDNAITDVDLHNLVSEVLDQLRMACDSSRKKGMKCDYPDQVNFSLKLKDDAEIDINFSISMEVDKGAENYPEKEL